LRSANIGNVDIDASTGLVEAVSSNGESTTPVHQRCTYSTMDGPPRVHMVPAKRQARYHGSFDGGYNLNVRE